MWALPGEIRVYSILGASSSSSMWIYNLSAQKRVNDKRAVPAPEGKDGQILRHICAELKFVAGLKDWCGSSLERHLRLAWPVLRRPYSWVISICTSLHQAHAHHKRGRAGARVQHQKADLLAGLLRRLGVVTGIGWLLRLIWCSWAWCVSMRLLFQVQTICRARTTQYRDA